MIYDIVYGQVSVYDYNFTSIDLEDRTKFNFRTVSSYPPFIPTNCKFFFVFSSFFPSFFFMMDFNIPSFAHTTEKSTAIMLTMTSINTVNMLMLSYSGQ